MILYRDFDYIILGKAGEVKNEKVLEMVHNKQSQHFNVLPKWALISLTSMGQLSVGWLGQANQLWAVGLVGSGPHARLLHASWFWAKADRKIDTQEKCFPWWRQKKGKHMFSPLLVLYHLIFHWLKQVMWPSSKSRDRKINYAFLWEKLENYLAMQLRGGVKNWGDNSMFHIDVP